MRECAIARFPGLRFQRKPSAQVSAKPLDNFPLVRSRNIEEVREAIGRVYAKPIMVPVAGVATLDTTYNNCRLGHVEIAYAAFGAAMRFEFPATGSFSQLFPIRGTGEVVAAGTSVSLAAHAGAVIGSDVEHTSSYSADYEQLIVRFNASALTERLSELTGETIEGPLRIGPRPDVRHPTAQVLQKYLPVLVETLGQATPPFPDWWIVQTEQFLMTLFLCGYQHNYSHLLGRMEPDSAPAEVRQAEAYIEANVHRAITIEELATVTGASAFSLFHSFKKSRGYSPQEFMARLRAKRGSAQ